MQTNTQTPTNPTVDYSKQISDWQTYTLALEGLDGIVRATDGVVEKYVTNDEAKKYTDASLRAFYIAVKGVHDEFKAGIETMKAGKAPGYTFDPTTIPDWTDPTTSDPKGIPAILNGVWQAIKPALEIVIGRIKMSKNENAATFEAAVAGLIDKGDAAIAELEKAFSS
jgi:hypothetical protein